ncbi:xanthine dehydrogenase family protein molybdopterin-binding subunit [Halopseudomonas pelagia]|uniref:Aldehyde oxidase n=1 Tax=Halopseudomonas pelagia TaxID=553151 RepID=A0AA91U3D8_9GAMM|nr:xanthine dehydrogenase family protein molybdopterin-binding subunit [Halopseudomonas pelagia]PCC99610.1 aldehyde oxidase [Halopseudomonas pelagia]QFY57283.1 xanthine dehydrogenase family protein molybdopterin-binding subunit [Halopseudomonas pelagia]
MNAKTSPVGKPLDRVDGPLKVQGQAQYASEFALPGLLYGSVVNSTIARGRIAHIHTRAAEAVPGVELVLTHENRPPIAGYDKPYEDDDAADGSPFRPLFNDRILYSGQPIALVVAENLELARYAGSLIKVEYEKENHATDLLANLEQMHEAPADLPDPRGDTQQALNSAAVKVEVEYTTPVEHHNPMEPHASTVHYLVDGKLEIYDKTQGVQNCMRYLEDVFDMKDQIRILSPYVGGAFGSGLRPQYQLPLAVMAALKLKRSVRVTLKRQQMFTFGYRPRSIQRLTIGAASDGQLQAIYHQAIAQTSTFEDFTEQEVEWSGMLYKCPNVELDYQLVPLDVYTPLDMRAPGATIGVYALECAMDELAYAANIDPVELRLKNFTTHNANEDKPYSSKALRECYEQGAERFGWSKRIMQPRSMQDGHQLVGWGMASGVWEAMQMPASAKACIDATGKLIVSSATTDIGTGTYTVMTQIAAEAMGFPMEQVEFKLGDSSMSEAPLQGGSFTVSSVGSAVQKACLELRRKLLDTVQQSPASPFSGKTLEEIDFADGWLFVKNDPEQKVRLTDIAVETGTMEAEASVEPGEERDGYATGTHSAVFVEVKVDEDTGMVKVSRVVSAIAAGRIVNPKTAGNQIVGGVVWGVGQALHEETQMDHQLGRFMNHNFAEYHIPVQADIGDIDVIFVEEHDEIVNALGSKGVGEIGIVGVAAAVSNAIFHATGKRVRDLPVTLDKLM